MAPRHNPNNGQGFTLAEVIVVVAIIGIAAMMVIPNAIGSDDLHVVAAARTITTDLQYAQNLAISTQTSIYVIFDTTGKTYTLSTTTNASGAVKHPITKSAYTVNLGTGGDFLLQSVATTFTNKTVKFDMLGTPDNVGTVTIQSGPHIYVISVAAVSGNVTVQQTGT